MRFLNCYNPSRSVIQSQGTAALSAGNQQKFRKWQKKKHHITCKGKGTLTWRAMTVPLMRADPQFSLMHDKKTTRILLSEVEMMLLLLVLLCTTLEQGGTGGLKKNPTDLNLWECSDGDSSSEEKPCLLWPAHHSNLKST